MSDWTVSLEFEEGTSSKFWRARVEGKTLYVNYGKIGSNGQTQVKDFADPVPRRRSTTSQGKAQERVRRSGGGGDADETTRIRRRRRRGRRRRRRRRAAQETGRCHAAPAAAPPVAKLVLESRNRKVETYLYLDGKTVRMDAVEIYASPESAKKAHERLKKTLLGDGYKEG
jgi:predicted DNA-binding WGR domain protein